MNRAQRWLQRASTAPLVMHIQDTSERRLGPNDAEASNVVALLASHMNELQALSVSLYNPDPRLVFSILQHLVIESSSPHVLLALDIVTHNTYSYTDNLADVIPVPPTLGQLLALASVRFLKLVSTYANWGSIVYYNLVKLNIETLPETNWPTMVQMAAILSASPMIQQLRLKDLGIVGHERFSSPNPIFLSELQELNLLYLSEGLRYILPLISPGPKLVNASIQLHNIWDEAPVRSFFHQSSVVTLYVKDNRQSYRSPGRALEFLSSLPHLRDLALELLDVSYEALATDLRLWPRLHTLHIIRSVVVSVSVPPTFNSNRSVHLLAMWGCCAARELGWMEGLHVRMSDIVSELREVVPRVTRNQESKACPARRWPVSM